jgi:predicted transcriptional regulator of viral defense system
MTKTLAKIQTLLDLPTFTRAEAEKKGVTGELLAYYVNQGVIERIAPGIYFDPSKEIKVEFQRQDLVRVAFSIKDGAICLISALDIYGLTEEIPRKFWIAIPHEMRAPVVPKTRFVRYRNMKLGMTKIKLGNIELSIFDKERTVVDAFRYLDREVSIKALRALVKQGLDYKKISSYSKKLKFDITPYLLSATT